MNLETYYDELMSKLPKEDDFLSRLLSAVSNGDETQTQRNPDIYGKLLVAAESLGARVRTVSRIEGDDADAQCSYIGAIDIMDTLEPTLAAGRLAHELGHWIMDYGGEAIGLPEGLEEFDIRNREDFKTLLKTLTPENQVKLLLLMIDSKPMAVKESRAESVAYLVMRRYGVEYGHSQPYISRFGATKDKLEEYKPEIIAAAGRIIDAADAAKAA
jgi:hypothetical protein